MATADNAPSLETYKKMFAEARDLLADNRLQQQIDDDYYHGYQLTCEERKVLNSRGQPDTVFNRYRKSINGTLGVLDTGATDPRAYGRNPGIDEDSADVVTKTLRYAADLNDFHELRLDCAYDYLVPGVCAALIEVDDRKRPKCTQIRWEEFFYDPRSRRKDFSDARYMGIAKWIYADTLKTMYPKSQAEIESSLSDSFVFGPDETFADRPRDGKSNWVDPKNRRLMTVEIYHNQNGWQRCVFYAGGILEAGPSPYHDERKQPDNAIVAMSCYVDRENNRMGIGRDMRSPQDEFNKRRSKLLHLLNNRQVQAQPNELGQMAFGTDIEAVRKEAAKPDGVLPPGWMPVPLTDLTAGQFNLLTLAETEMDRQGPNPAILGRQAQDASGRAQQVRQEAGLTEDAVVYRGIHNWEIRMYRSMWNRCRQFWTAPDYIRVTDDEGSPQYIGINQPMMGPPQVVMGEGGMPTIKPQALGYKNALAELDVDIDLDVVPDTATLAQEQFQTLAELAKMYGPQEVPFDDMLELSDMPNKSKLVEKRKQRQEQQGQMGMMGQQLQMQAAQLQMQEQQQKVRQTAAQADLAQAQTLTELAKPHIEAAKVGVDLGQQPGAQQETSDQMASARLKDAQTLEVHAKIGKIAAETHNEMLKPHLEAEKMRLQAKSAAGKQSGASG